jgi:Na+/H+ antiporter NhaC
MSPRATRGYPTWRLCNGASVLFAVVSIGKGTPIEGIYNFDMIKVLPYIVVLIAALSGMNVLYVLVVGSFLAGLIGLIYGSFDIIGLFQAAAKGIGGMSELVVISLIIGGMVQLIKFNGGIDFILNQVTKRVKSKGGAELGIAALVSLVDICTANNTIAIVTVGPIAKDIADKYGVDPKRSASILDMFSCVFQGVIPYGAQLLSAASLAGLSSISIMGYLYYPYLMGFSALIAIVLLPKLRKV